MPVPRALASLAVPTIISQLINLVYNVVDTFFIGRAGNVYMTAAVTASFTLFMMTVSFGNLFGVGGGSLIARLSGMGREKEGKSVCAFSVWGAFATALLYSLGVGLFAKPLLTLLGANEDSMPYALQYTYVVVVAGNIPIILSMTTAHLLRNAGYSRQASLGLSLGGVLNIALDPLLMFLVFPRLFGPGLEVLGAAVATWLANGISCVYLLLTLTRIGKTSPLCADPRKAAKISGENLKRLFAVGLPSAALTALFDVANIVLNKLMSLHGQMEMAAVGIVMKAERLPNAINIGLCQGMLPLVAYNYASGNHKRMQETIRTAFLAGLGICALCLLFYELFADTVTGVFLATNGEDSASAVATIALAALFLRIRACSAPLQFLNYHTSFCLQGVGSGGLTLLHAFVREMVCYIPLMILMNLLWGTNGLAAGVVAGEGLGGIFALWLWHRWKKKNLAK